MRRTGSDTFIATFTDEGGSDAEVLVTLDRGDIAVAQVEPDIFMLDWHGDAESVHAVVAAVFALDRAGRGGGIVDRRKN